jgi:hypothetical protein
MRRNSASREQIDIVNELAGKLLEPYDGRAVPGSQALIVPQAEGIVWNREHLRHTSITKRTQVLPGIRPISAAPSR